jgi:hypothetical protein
VWSASPVSAQSNATDPDRHVVIISGASGEPVYAKQFEQWTSSLQAALSERFGFPKNRVKLLVEKPANPTAVAATAEEVKKLFASLRTELNPDSVLFVFLSPRYIRKRRSRTLFRRTNTTTCSGAANAARRANMASSSGEFIKPPRQGR